MKVRPCGTVVCECGRTIKARGRGECTRCTNGRRAVAAAYMRAKRAAVRQELERRRAQGAAIREETMRRERIEWEQRNAARYPYRVADVGTAWTMALREERDREAVLLYRAYRDRPTVHPLPSVTTWLHGVVERTVKRTEFALSA